MNKRTTLKELDVIGKRVLVRADLDVGEGLGESDLEKLKTTIPTLQYLLEKKAKIVVIGHRGRPDGKVDGKLSLLPVSEKLQELLNQKIDFVYDISGHEAKEKSLNLKDGEIVMLENLRFDEREEKNDDEFAKSLSELGDLFVNEAFSASHRDHASIVGIPKYLKTVLGLRFEREIENLSKIFENPKKPVVVIISGVKKDKLDYVEPFSKFADKILIAGRLPEIIDVKDIGKSDLDDEFRNKILQLIKEERVVVASLIQDKEDITLHSMERFEQEIEKAGTIVVGGPIGKFEDEGHSQGTKRVFEAVVNNKDAFKVAGGGDTEQAIQLFGLKDRFDWVSVGGGASLEFLAKGTLPGIEVLIN